MIYIFVYAQGVLSERINTYHIVNVFPFSWKTSASRFVIENCNIPFHINVSLDRLGNLLINLFYKSRIKRELKACLRLRHVAPHQGLCLHYTHIDDDEIVKVPS